MNKMLKKGRQERVLSLLPRRIGDEIDRLARGRLGGLLALREVRIRREGVCSVRLGLENIRLFSSLNTEEMDSLIERVTQGALYAHRDSIAEGYVSLPGGIRVGVCGSAAYDGERLVGIGEISSLNFRIPTGECAFSEEIYEIFRSGIGRGMLIYSPPGVGKTTAIRSLAAAVGGGRTPLKVAVVDERGELDPEDVGGCEVDILRGYKRREGIEIATRTMTPDLIMIDEIGADDADAILRVVKCGIPLIATAHASSAAELLQRPTFRGLFDCSVFDVLVGISHQAGEYMLTVDRL